MVVPLCLPLAVELSEPFLLGLRRGHHQDCESFGPKVEEPHLPSPHANSTPVLVSSAVRLVLQ